jgi:hypothetical protein
LVGEAVQKLAGLRSLPRLAKLCSVAAARLPSITLNCSTPSSTKKLWPRTRNAKLSCTRR